MNTKKQVKKTSKKVEWIDFSLKINYIYEKLFKNNKEKLISYFSIPNLSMQERKNRGKTIKNWLTQKKQISRPNKFHLDLFKIADYKMPDGTSLFTLDAFELWNIEQFEQRVDEYLSLQNQNATLEERMQYIYYFDIDSESLAYYEILFPNADKPYEIHLYSSQLTNNMLYKGEMQEFQGMLYLFLKNEFDHMIYVFENFATVFSQELRVFGTGQCKDYFSRKPKAYMALLSSSILSEQEEQKYAHKLNRSNLLIAKPFSRHNKLTKEYLVENFSHKVEMLNQDLSYYRDSSRNNLYYELAFQTFTAYERVVKKLSYNSSYFVRNKKSIKELIFKSLATSQQAKFANLKPKVEILYALTPSNITLLEVDSPYFSDIIREQIKLVDEERLELSYLFVVTDKKLIDNKVIQKLENLADYIPLKIVENSRPHYEEIIYPHDEQFIIYQTFNDIGNYVHISKHSKDRMDIHREYQLLLHEAIVLEEFISQRYPLNGKWYSYSFGSTMDKHNHHTVELEISNNSIVGNFPSGIHHGMIQECRGYTLLLLDNSVIKIQNQNLQDRLFRTSIIGKEQNIHHRDVLLFGLMSREQIESKDVCMLLDTIQKKENEHFRLKVNDGFESILSKFLLHDTHQKIC